MVEYQGSQHWEQKTDSYEGHVLQLGMVRPVAQTSSVGFPKKPVKSDYEEKIMN